jgi:hypothetical protein
MVCRGPACASDSIDKLHAMWRPPSALDHLFEAHVHQTSALQHQKLPLLPQYPAHIWPSACMRLVVCMLRLTLRLFWWPPAAAGDCGYHLHSMQLQFRHPSTGAVVTIQAPIPDALKTPQELQQPDDAHGCSVGDGGQGVCSGSCGSKAS